ncbi:centrosomal protein of 55 kDa-like [Hemibagrus wyckioides]|uniref:centrosomal protein of 55 kDa-like n=1 Tax=Hemibagrus wyckioides TaxID=337641 RepID=UPI00266C9632|nr:centrosomal protein of 55 kDa-like [Hemibagrus wyckioides]
MASKLSGHSRSFSDGDIDQLRKEKAHLRNTLDEVSDQQGAPPHSQDTQVYLERILALETLRERNSQQILAKDQEIASLWQMLRSDSAEVVSSLQNQVRQLRAEAEVRETLFQSLQQETEEMKEKLEAVLGNASKSTADGRTATGNSTLMQEQLIDALEKNQQWLEYDQQREAYVTALLAQKYQLEQELNKALLEKEIERDTAGEEQEVEILQCYEKLEREQQKVQQLLTENHQMEKELVEEKLKSAELQQQIQLSAKDLEDKERDNQHIQSQLKGALKELRRALKKVETFNSERAQRETASSVSGAYPELERVHKESPKCSSSSPGALLDNSFLECPNCGVQYPSSGHRELLIHIDLCFDTN